MRDPDRLVSEGALDASLMHTLSSTCVALPPLSERAVDIPLLAEHMAARRGKTVAPDGLAWLEQQTWHHNVRELDLALERAAHANAGATLHAADFTIADPRSNRGGSGTGQAHPEGPGAPVPGAMTLEALERAYIAETLDAVQWHQGRAAEALGISPKTLYRKIREYGFKRPSGRGAR
jgi:DNA-binding NtrC family response regulator